MILDPVDLHRVQATHRADLQRQFHRTRLTAEIRRRWVRNLIPRGLRFVRSHRPRQGEVAARHDNGGLSAVANLTTVMDGDQLADVNP